MTMRNTLPAALILALAFGCGPSQEELDTERARVRELQSELAQTRADREALDIRLGTLESRNQELTARLAALGDNVEQLQGERSRLQRALDELRERERQAQSRLDVFRQLLERFRSMIESGRLRVRVVRNRMVVELPEGVLFDSGRAGLKSGGQTTLGEVADVLRTIEGREFQVSGHTDNIPVRVRFRDNWELSSERAVTVLRFMVSRGFPSDRLSAAGYADTQPVASNDSPEGRAQNRRIEIALVPNLDELPDLSSLATP
jgi:chemotaxis protein MotB